MRGAIIPRKFTHTFCLGCMLGRAEIRALFAAAGTELPTERCFSARDREGADSDAVFLLDSWLFSTEAVPLHSFRGKVPAVGRCLRWGGAVSDDAGLEVGIYLPACPPGLGGRETEMLLWLREEERGRKNKKGYSRYSTAISSRHHLPSKPLHLCSASDMKTRSESHLSLCAFNEKSRCTRTETRAAENRCKTC